MNDFNKSYFMIATEAIEHYVEPFIRKVVNRAIVGKEDLWWNEVINDPKLNIHSNNFPTLTKENIGTDYMDLQCCLKFLYFDGHGQRTVNARNLLSNGTLNHSQCKKFMSQLGNAIQARNEIYAHKTPAMAAGYSKAELDYNLSAFVLLMEAFKEVSGFEQDYHRMKAFSDKYKEYVIQNDGKKSVHNISIHKGERDDTRSEKTEAKAGSPKKPEVTDRLNVKWSIKVLVAIIVILIGSLFSNSLITYIRTLQDEIIVEVDDIRSEDEKVYVNLTINNYTVRDYEMEDKFKIQLMVYDELDDTIVYTRIHDFELENSLKSGDSVGISVAVYKSDLEKEGLNSFSNEGIIAKCMSVKE